METLSCIATRHSTRNFKPDMVPDDILAQVLEAGRRAPSGKHKNQNHFIVVRRPEVLAELVQLVRNEFAKMEITPENEADIGGAIKRAKKGDYVFRYNAPVFIIVANKKNYGNNMADVCCAMENMLLAANALDLGSCWINQLRWLNENPVLIKYLQGLGMAEDERVYASMSLGYAALPDGLPNRRVVSITGNPITFID